MSKKHPKSHSKHSTSHASHHEEVEVDAEEVSASSSDEINTEAQNEGVHAEHPSTSHEGGTFNAGSADDQLAPEEMSYEGGPIGEEPDKTHVEFYGSEIIRMKAPKVMELADTVADEWKKDGNFESLPVGHPLAAMAAGRALRKAKDVEKKLEEKGVFAMAKMGMEYVKSEIEKRRKH